MSGRSRVANMSSPVCGAIFQLCSILFNISAYIVLGSRLVSVLDSGAEGPGFRSQLRRRLRQTVHTHRASVHHAAKFVAALVRVAGITAGLAESNGSLPPGS